MSIELFLGIKLAIASEKRRNSAISAYTSYIKGYTSIVIYNFVYEVWARSPFSIVEWPEWLCQVLFQRVESWDFGSSHDQDFLARLIPLLRFVRANFDAGFGATATTTAIGQK